MCELRKSLKSKAILCFSRQSTCPQTTVWNVDGLGLSEMSCAVRGGNGPVKGLLPALVGECRFDVKIVVVRFIQNSSRFESVPVELPSGMPRSCEQWMRQRLVVPSVHAKRV